MVLAAAGSVGAVDLDERAILVVRALVAEHQLPPRFAQAEMVLELALAREHLRERMQILNQRGLAAAVGPHEGHQAIVQRGQVHRYVIDALALPDPDSAAELQPVDPDVQAVAGAPLGPCVGLDRVGVLKGLLHLRVNVPAVLGPQHDLVPQRVRLLDLAGAHRLGGDDLCRHAGAGQGTHREEGILAKRDCSDLLLRVPHGDPHLEAVHILRKHWSRRVCQDLPPRRVWEGKPLDPRNPAPVVAKVDQVESFLIGLPPVAREAAPRVVRREVADLLGQVNVAQRAIIGAHERQVVTADLYAARAEGLAVRKACPRDLAVVHHEAR